MREIREELTAEISVGELIKTVEFDYPGFHLSMDCFWSKVISGRLVLKEADEARWLTKEDLDSVKWLPADRELIERINSYYRLFYKFDRLDGLNTKIHFDEK